MITAIGYFTPPINTFDKSTYDLQHLIGGLAIINYMAQVGMTVDLIQPYENSVMEYAQKD